VPGPQRIPRPPGARPGDDPPWAEVPAELRRGIGIAHVRAALDRVGQLETIPAPFGRIAAAVLVPVFEEDGEARVILTRRASHLRSHRGEVSFPGGRIEAEETPLSAALREAAEEIGLDPAPVEILGQLQPLATVSSSSSITPFVGVLPERQQLHPNPGEVERVFDVSIAELLADGVFTEERWLRPQTGEFPVYFFDLPEDLVWGATARILHEFLGLVLNERTGPPPAGR
jgi:8-oxo-dGTP pyrophosphatase MutT (NUDIX family)